MSGSMRADEATFDAVASELRQGADHMMGSGEPPLPIQAGRVSGVLAALGAQLANEAETLAGELGGAAQKVDAAAASFAEVDQDAVRAVTPDKLDVNRPPGSSHTDWVRTATGTA